MKLDPKPSNTPDPSVVDLSSASIAASRSGGIWDTFVGHFSPGLDQLEEYERNQKAQKALGPLAIKLRDLIDDVARPEISGEHTRIAGSIRSAIAAQNKDELCEALERFANAATNGRYDDPATIALEARCHRGGLELKDELGKTGTPPWEELSAAVR